MKRLVIWMIICFFSSPQILSQERREFKRAMFVDGTYLLSFFKTEEARITPFNLKFPLTEKYNFRTGFNLNRSTSSNRGFEGDLKIGIEAPHQYSDKWSYYYGVDVNGAYYNYNDRPNTTVVLSAMPFFGFEVFLTKEFSLSYEPKLIFSHYKYSNPDSFTDQVTYNEEIKLTGLTQFFINFNF